MSTTTAVWRRLRAGAAEARAAARRVPPLAILVVGGLLVVAYAYPGYMNYDAADQLWQSRVRHYSDWHPALMARYWHYLDQFIHGPITLLLLQVTLFLWGLYGLFARRFERQTAAFMTVVVLWFPPVLAPYAVVWKDSQMVGFLLAGVMFALRASWRSRLAGLLLLFFAAGVRDNASFALPPLLLLVAWTWGYRRKLAVCGVAFALFVAIVGSAMVANRLLAQERAYAWSKANAIHDIAGMICFGDPMTDAEVREALVGIKLRADTDLQKRLCEQYNPRWWFPLAFDAGSVFYVTPDEPERGARRDAYFKLLRRRPLAFLETRWRVTRELLGLRGTPDEPICQTFVGAASQAEQLEVRDSRSFFQRVIGRKLERYARTMMFLPWVYAVIGLAMLGFALHRRDGLLIAVITSGFLYEASFFIGAAGAPFRYSNWMVLCTCIATLAVFADRLRAGITAHEVSPRS